MVKLKTGVESHSLEDFGLRGMIECGRGIREVARSAGSMESAARTLVTYFRETFKDKVTGKPECVLVRCFKTHSLSALPADLQLRGDQLLKSNAERRDALPCLTLLATAGDEPDWNDRMRSTGHAVIPLESVEVVERAPMIAQLIQQMGLEIGAVLTPTKQLLLQADERAYGVFHVPDAEQSPFIPAQNFVQKNGVRSVLGFGGLLPSGELFAMIMFSRIHISRETADLFRTLALSVKLVLLPFTRGPVFDHETSVTTLDRRLGYEEERLRSEIATLNLLIPALEEAAMYQTDRLENVVTDLQKRAAEVKQLRSQLGSMLESTTDAVFILDSDWRFTYLNQNALGILNADHELLGRNIWEEFPAAAELNFWQSYHRVMEQRTPEQFEEYFPEPLNKWFDVHAFPSEDGIAVFFHDVTDRRRADAALIQSEKLAIVGRLAGSIAHEVNNPLESVTNLLYLARTSESQEEIREHLELADRELRRASAITTKTLRFYKQASSPTPMRIDQMMDDVLSIHRGRLLDAGVTVDLENRMDVPVLCFEGEIRQVMNNLVGNAIDAMSGSGGRLLLRNRPATDCETGREGLRMTVADTGSGMSAEAEAQAFEAFYSTKGIGGTGLGLWISREIVSRHEGRLRFRSREGRGTVFTLFLPSKAVVR